METVTLEQMLIILSTLKVAYVNEFKNLTDADIKIQVNLWLNCLKEFTYEEIEKAIYTYISSNTSKFSPNIAEVKMLILKNKHKNFKTAEEAFIETRQAIRGNLEFSKLNKITQEIIGDERELFNLGQQENSYITTFFKNHFLKSYNEKLDSAFCKLAEPKNLLIENQERKMIK